MLETVRRALHIATTAYDTELQALINAGLADLGLAGVDQSDTTDPLIVMAMVTYCRVRFGSPDDYSRLKKAYDEQKAQLQMATGYTDWGDDD